MSLFTQPVSLSDTYLLQLFNLQASHVDDISIVHKTDGLYASITLTKVPHSCPACGFETKTIKGYTKKKILHSLTTHTPCFINYKARRFVCDACHKTFYENNPFAYKNMKISLLTVFNVLNDLKFANETFSSGAKRYSISDTTVTHIFDNHVFCTRRSLPECICIDEVYAFHSDKSDYVCVLVDFVTGKTIDLLSSRRKEELEKYFRQIHLDERKKVKYFVMDMWDTYRIIAKHIFPNSCCIVDKFHLFQELGRKITAVRMRTMNDYKPTKRKKETMTPIEIAQEDERKKKYYVLKKFHWLLFKNKDSKVKVETEDGKSVYKYLFDPNIEKKYNRTLARYMNYYDLHDYMLSINKEFETLMNLKIKFDLFYSESTIDTAKSNLEDLISEFSSSGIKELVDFSHTMIRWKKEMINSFYTINKNGKDVYMNNAIIENRNKTIKQLKNNGNGYTNLDRFRNRNLYVLNDDVNYRIQT